jgi:PIN domain nuclease of toxin-antitoxin system
MKLLLDTHTFIWWDSEPQRLSQQVLNMCQDPENELLVSVASLWEMQIKLQLGKLKLNKPFDRLLIAQADIEEAILVSKDQIFTEYEVKLVW